MASYPTSAKTFTTKSNGGTIDASHINDLQDEVNAIETDLITGLPIGRGGTGLTSLAANRIPYSTGSAHTSSASLTFDGSTFTTAALVATTGTFSGVLTVNALGTHEITGGSNAAQTLGLKNTTSGTAGKVEHLQTAGTAIGRLTTFSQGFTTSGVEILSTTLLQAQAAGGLVLSASHADGLIRFYAGGSTLRATFDDDGDFYVGTITAVPSGATIGKAFQQTNAYCLVSGIVTTAAQNHNEFVNGNGLVGSISTNASATAFNTSSDQRLKDDRGIASDLSALLSVKVHDFIWKADGLMDRGVFAQEVRAVMPKVVTVGSDKRDTDGKLAQPWAVDYSKFVPDLIVAVQQHAKAIQELQARG